MTAFEKFVLSGWFSPHVLDSAKLWFDRPRSSFTQEDDAEKGLYVNALTTKNGIYFPFPNHEFATPQEFSLLAHELVHWRDRVDHIHYGSTAEGEAPAYQMQVSVRNQLDRSLSEKRAAFGK